MDGASFTSVTVTVTSCVSVKLPSETVTVAVTEEVVSKSGAVTKVRTPVDESIAKSDPDTENVNVSLSGSVAVTVPIAV